MLVSVVILLIITSSVLKIDGRSIDYPDHPIPSFLSSISDNVPSPTSHNRNQLLHVIEYIIKHVSKIKSDENFIDNIINQQEHIFEKIKILQFLNKYFQITNKVIQCEIDYFFNTESIFPVPFTLEELKEAQDGIYNLLQIIKDRMNLFTSRIPPTMPFLHV